MKSPGFTIVELMLVMSISILMMGWGIIRYVDFNRTQVIKNTGLTIKNNLRDAEIGAISGNRPLSGCVGNLLGYQVTFAVSSYQIDASCASGASGNIVTYTLPQNFIFNSIPSSFTFSVLAQGTSGVNRVIFVRTSGSLGSKTKWYGICVKTSGDIDDSTSNGCGYTISASLPTCTCT